MTYKILLPAVLLVFPWAGGSALADEAARGEAVYGNYCINCHGDVVDGLEAFQGDMAAFRNALAVTENMPDFSGMITDEEARELFAYLMAERAAAGGP